MLSSGGDVVLVGSCWAAGSAAWGSAGWLGCSLEGIGGEVEGRDAWAGRGCWADVTALLAELLAVAF